MQEQINATNSRLQSTEEIVRRLEEREKTLQAAVQSMEKEIGLRVQAAEMHKRKAIETTQQVAEVSFKLEGSNKQLSEVCTSSVVLSCLYAFPSGCLPIKEVIFPSCFHDF